MAESDRYDWVTRKFEQRHLAHSDESRQVGFTPFSVRSLHAVVRSGLAYLSSRLETHELVRVLDLGCGNGNYLRHLKRAFPESQIVGVDLVPENIEAALRRGYSEGHVLNAAQVGDRLGSTVFDVAFSVEMIHYLEPADRQRFLRGVEQKLTPGGSFLLVYPNMRSFVCRVTGFDPDEFRFPYTTDDVIDEARRAGLELDRLLGSGLVMARAFQMSQDQPLKNGAAFRCGLILRKPG